MTKLPLLYISSPQFVREGPIIEEPIIEEQVIEEQIIEEQVPQPIEAKSFIENELIARQLQFFAQQWPPRNYIFELKTKEKLIGKIERVQHAMVTLRIGDKVKVLDGNEIHAIYYVK